jgi:hypothetical protein
MNNDAVIKLVKAGLSDDLIVTTINSSTGNYDTSADALSALKAAGASGKVIAAMVLKAAGSAKVAPAAPAPVVPAQEPPAETGGPSESVPFVTAPSGARVREEFLGDAPASGKSGLVFFPYQAGRKVLYWIPQGGALYDLVTESGRRFDGVRTNTPVLSADGRHVAVAIGTPVSVKWGPPKWDVLFDGQVIPCQADEIPRMVFSPDGTRLAFVATYGQQSLVRVVGGADGPKYDWVGPLAFSPDSAHLIYAAGFGARVNVLIDHKVVWSQETTCRSTLDVRSDASAYSAFFSPNSSSWAVATTGCSGNQSYNVNGKLEAESYGALSPIAFSPDGRHYAYLAVKLEHGMWVANKGIGVVVEDGQPSPEYEGIGLPAGSGTLRVLIEPNAAVFGVSAPRYTANGKLLYVARRKPGYVVIEDGEPGPMFDEILTDPVTSDGGRHMAYMAVRNKELLTVVDGQATGLGGVVPYDDFSFIEWFGFAPGGKLAAILNKHGKMWSEDMHAQRRILWDGKLGTQYDCLRMYEPAFSFDGLHYAFGVTGIKNKDVKGAPQNVPRVVVDDHEGPDYTSIVFPRQWLVGGAAVYFAVKDGKLYRVTQQGR